MTQASGEHPDPAVEIARLRQRIIELENAAANHAKVERKRSRRVDAPVVRVPPPSSRDRVGSSADTERLLSQSLRRAEQRIREQDAELAHALRLTTIGEMTAQISHEVNQPLSAIANLAHACQAELARPGEGDLEAVRDWLRQIGQSATRARDVVRGIASFVRRGSGDAQRIALRALLESSIELVAWRTSRLGIEIRMEPLDTNLCVVADPVRLEQVFVNLLTNACDALETAAARFRRIVVRTGVGRELETGPGTGVGGGAGTEFAEITIEDNGCGIPAAIQESIFRPFVTTKPTGLGLGLAICRTIVEGYGGRIWPVDRAGGGTCFHVRLPSAR